MQGWDPMKSIKWLIRHVQHFLEKHGRVDADDERNDPRAHPEGSYSSAEHALCRLGHAHEQIVFQAARRVVLAVGARRGERIHLVVESEKSSTLGRPEPGGGGHGKLPRCSRGALGCVGAAWALRRSTEAEGGAVVGRGGGHFNQRIHL